MNQPKQANPQANKPNIKVIEAHDESLCSADLEQAVIGAVLSNPYAFIKANIILDGGNAFYYLRHNYIWDALIYLHENDMAIDTVTVSEVLIGKGQLAEVGGPAYLTQCCAAVQSTLNYETYARMVERLYNHRQIKWLGDTIKHAPDSGGSVEQVIATVQNATDKILDGISRRIIPTMQDYANDHLDLTDKLQQSGETIDGINSGIPGLHNLIGELFPGLILVAGRTHEGKTITMMTIALNAAQAGKKVLYINNADGDAETVFNMFLSMQSGLPKTMLQRRTWNAQQKPRYIQGLSDVTSLPLFIEHEDNITPKTIQAKAAVIQRTHGLDMIVLDYIQNCGVGAEGLKVYPNKKMQIDYVSESLKHMRKQFNVPIVYGAQLHRKSRDTKPQLDEIQDSSKIAHDADIIAVVWQPIEERKELNIKIAKNRETNNYGTCRVSFNGTTGQLAK